MIPLQAVVLEGKYWKRRLQSVISEYRKWRKFFKDHCTGSQDSIDVGITTLLLVAHVPLFLK
jgi:MAX-like protein X